MTTRPMQPEYYTDEAGEVRWRVIGENGEIVAASSEGFVNLRKAWDNYNLGLQGRNVTMKEAKEQHAEEPADSASGEASSEAPDSEEGAGGSEASSSSEDAPNPRARGSRPKGEGHS